ncbi:MAG: hypothetical protein ACR2QR_05815 [Woeseiaceae bacterium]
MKTTMLSGVYAALMSFSAASLADVTTQYSMVSDLTGSATTTGAASLVRSKKEVSGRISTNLSLPGLPITVWFIVFNNPDACSGDIFTDPGTGVMTACSIDDVFAGPGGSPGGPADPAVINATGGISSGNGMSGGAVNLTYELKAGAGSGGPNQPCCFGKLRKNNGHGAEVHLLVDEHHVFDDWITDLFFPNPPAEGNQRGVVFLPLDNDDDSDSDSDSD